MIELHRFCVHRWNWTHMRKSQRPTAFLLPKQTIHQKQLLCLSLSPSKSNIPELVVKCRHNSYSFYYKALIWEKGWKRVWFRQWKGRRCWWRATDCMRERVEEESSSEGEGEIYSNCVSEYCGRQLVTGNGSLFDFDFDFDPSVHHIH